MEYTDADLKALLKAFYQKVEDFVIDTGRLPGRDAKEDMMAEVLRNTPLPSKFSKGGGPESK